MKKLLSGCLCTLFIILPLFAQLKDLTINADRVSLEKDKSRIEAEGSVEAAYKNFVLRGNHLIYNTSAETMRADRGFSLVYQGVTFEGETLDFDIKNYLGQSEKVNFFYRGVLLGGGRLIFNSELYELKNAKFTTCDISSPHYSVTAADILLYPGHGWMVAYWGLFWLGGFPIVPMPTYIYDFRASERAQKNLPPFPEVGTNVDDGSYINERLAWHLRREFSGTYSFGYSANKGLGLGANANYILDENNRGDVRLNWNAVNRGFGGLTHLYYFGDEVAGKDIFGLFGSSLTHQYELETTLAYHERINYQRVSLYPDVRLRARRPHFDLELLGGMAAETGGTRLRRGGGSLRIYGEAKTLGLDGIAPALTLVGTYYSNGTKWVKPSVGIDLHKNFPGIKLGAGYQHFLYVEGQSPFNYEMYHFRAVDLLKSEASFMIGETGSKIAASYYLDNWTPQDIDYSLFFRLHCYNLDVTYRSVRGEFVFGVSLTAR